MSRNQPIGYDSPHYTEHKHSPLINYGVNPHAPLVYSPYPNGYPQAPIVMMSAPNGGVNWTTIIIAIAFAALILTR